MQLRVTHIAPDCCVENICRFPGPIVGATGTLEAPPPPLWAGGPNHKGHEGRSECNVESRA